MKLFWLWNVVLRSVFEEYSNTAEAREHPRNVFVADRKCGFYRPSIWFSNVRQTWMSRLLCSWWAKFRANSLIYIVGHYYGLLRSDCF